MLSLTAVLASLPPASLAETDLARFIAQALGRRQRSELMGLASLFYEEPLRGYPHSLGAIFGAFCEVLIEEQRDPQHLDTRTCDVLLGSPAFLERLGRRVELRRQRLRPGTLIHGELRAVLGMRLVMLPGIGRELMLVHPVELAQVPDARFTMPQGVVLARPADVAEAERIRTIWNQLEELLGFEHPEAPLWESRFFAHVRRENHDVETLRQGLAPLHPDLRRRLWEALMAHLRDQELPEQHRPGRRGVDVRLSSLGLDADRPWVQPLVSMAELIYRAAGMDANVAAGRCPCTLEDFARWSQWDDVPVVQRQRLLGMEPAELEVWLVKLSEEEAGRADGLVPEQLRRPLTSLRDTCLRPRWQRAQNVLMGHDPLQLAEARALSGDDRGTMIVRLEELLAQARLALQVQGTPAVVKAPSSTEPVLHSPFEPAPPSLLSLSDMRSPFEEDPEDEAESEAEPTPAPAPPPRVPAWGEGVVSPFEKVATPAKPPVAPRTERRPSLLDELPERHASRQKARPLTISETLEQTPPKREPLPDLGAGPAVGPPRFQLPPMPEVPPMRATPRVRARGDLPPMPPAHTLPEASWGAPGGSQGPRRVSSSLLTPPRRRLNTQGQMVPGEASPFPDPAEALRAFNEGQRREAEAQAQAQAQVQALPLSEPSAEPVEPLTHARVEPESDFARSESTAELTPESASESAPEAQALPEIIEVIAAKLEAQEASQASQAASAASESQRPEVKASAPKTSKAPESKPDFVAPPKPEAKALPKVSVQAPRAANRQRPITIPHLVTPSQANTFYEHAFRELERIERDTLQRGASAQLVEAAERISEEARELYDALGPSARSGDREFQQAQRRLEKVQAYLDRVLILLAPRDDAAPSMVSQPDDKPEKGGLFGRFFGRGKR